MNKSEKIKSRLLKIYKKNNPSKPTNLKKVLKINQDIIENKLKFPSKFLKI